MWGNSMEIYAIEADLHLKFDRTDDKIIPGQIFIPKVSVNYVYGRPAYLNHNFDRRLCVKYSISFLINK